MMLIENEGFLVDLDEDDLVVKVASLALILVILIYEIWCDEYLDDNDDLVDKEEPDQVNEKTSNIVWQ